MKGKQAYEEKRVMQEAAPREDTLIIENSDALWWP
jgi:hypothetical protein